MEMERWITAFIHTYRGEASRLSTEEKNFLGEYIEEQCLSQPCQVEVLEFDDPYRLVWIFLFDRSKPDLTISVHKENWTDSQRFIEEVQAKYRELNLDQSEMRRMLDGFHHMSSECAYSIDGLKGALGLCFSHNFCIGNWPFASKLGVDTNPQEVAKIMFHLNYSQARDRY